MEETPFLEAERSDNDSIVHYVIIHKMEKEETPTCSCLCSSCCGPIGREIEDQ